MEKAKEKQRRQVSNLMLRHMGQAIVIHEGNQS